MRRATGALPERSRPVPAPPARTLSHKRQLSLTVTPAQMGFDWSGSVVVEYGVRVKIPACVARFAKRLSHFRPVAPSLFASTAKTLAEVGSLDALDQLPEQIAKRAREEARPLPADDDGASTLNDPEAGSEACAFSDIPSDMDADERAVYEPAHLAPNMPAAKARDDCTSRKGESAMSVTGAAQLPRGDGSIGRARGRPRHAGGMPRRGRGERAARFAA